MQDFRRLKVWHKAHALEMAARKLIKTLPREERYELCSQIRRSAASIPSNIVEGTCRGSDRDCRRFLRIAIGSTSELIQHLLVARDAEMIPSSTFERMEAAAVEVQRMLCGFANALEDSTRRREKRTG